MSDDERPRVLTVLEVAKWLNLHPRTIRRAIADKRIPALRIGREYRIDARHIEKLLEQGGSLGVDEEDGA